MSTLPPACICTPGVMWMNSDLVLILEQQINPNTKSDCSSAICTCRKKQKSEHWEPLSMELTTKMQSHTYHSLCVVTSSQGPLGAHLRY